MNQTTPNTENTPQNPIQVLSQLLGGQQQAVVLVVDEDERLLDYRVQPLSELVADLAVSGLAKPGDKPMNNNAETGDERRRRCQENHFRGFLIMSFFETTSGVSRNIRAHLFHPLPTARHSVGALCVDSRFILPTDENTIAKGEIP